MYRLGYIWDKETFKDGMRWYFINYTPTRRINCWLLSFLFVFWFSKACLRFHKATNQEILPHVRARENTVSTILPYDHTCWSPATWRVNRQQARHLSSADYTTVSKQSQQLVPRRVTVICLFLIHNRDFQKAALELPLPCLRNWKP